ncbi:hypothetical protein [Pelagibius sp. Alg239-R121]|uniref:hypothetical protein n=1 Tax=Pelagibius sp. Alg239-R121 TaxID=2993448 RepID=UPI0024A76BD0|nr:hypothetical protein [Pelagibius sp. Alg239-R121]
MPQETTEGSRPPNTAGSEQDRDRGTGGSGTPAEAPGGSPAQEPADWTEGLNDEQRALLATKGWKAPGAVLESYRHLEKLIGRDKIAIPKDGDGEAWNAVFDRLGRPESAEGYEIAVPEGVERDAAFEEQMRELFHSAGLTKTQVAALSEGWHGYLGGETARGEQLRIERAARDEEALRSEWGGSFDRNMEQARRAARRFGDAETIDGLEEAVGRAAVFKMFARIGSAMAEDDLQGEASESFSQPGSVRAQITALKADPAFREAWLEHSHPGHPQAVARMAALTEKLEILS